jgi:hypothetical protein
MTMLIPIVLGILFPVSYIAHMLASKAEAVVEHNKSEPFHTLQRQFFTVYFLAAFSDWLQGPYIYQVYRNYGYTEPQIALLYVTGFFSSMVCGTGVSYKYTIDRVLFILTIMQILYCPR